MSICERCRREMTSAVSWPPEVDTEEGTIVVNGDRRLIGRVEIDILGVLWQGRDHWIDSNVLMHKVWGALPPNDHTRRQYLYTLRRRLQGTEYNIITRQFGPGECAVYRLVVGVLNG